MANGGQEGNTAGNRQINANSTVTIGLALAVFIATAAAIYKAGEVITDLSYLKIGMSKFDARISELSTEVAHLRRALEAHNRQQNNAVGR